VWVNGWWLSRAVAPDSSRVEIGLLLIRSSTSQSVNIDEPLGSRTACSRGCHQTTGLEQIGVHCAAAQVSLARARQQSAWRLARKVLDQRSDLGRRPAFLITSITYPRFWANSAPPRARALSRRRGGWTSFIRTADRYRWRRNLGSRLANMRDQLPSVAGRALLRSFANFRPKEEPCRSTWTSTASMVQ
jgi:hypothetical protein